MSRPAIFFDRDNTLLACDGYLGDPAGVALVPGAADAVARARAMGYATVVVSNQSGVARGMFDIAAVDAVNKRFDEALIEQNPRAAIDAHEFCPYHPDATVEAYRQDSDLRKPKPGMILKAARDHDLDLPRSWLVGDAPRDIEAGKTAGCRTILFRDPSLARSPAADAESDVSPDFTVSSLDEAMRIIEENSPAPSPGTPGEGGGEGSAETSNMRSQISQHPHPNPLPEYREREQDAFADLLHVTQQILVEVRRRNEQNPAGDFSVSKLLAGIAQVLVLAVLFLAYLNRNGATQTMILVALTLQAMTIALLIMGRQR